MKTLGILASLLLITIAYIQYSDNQLNTELVSKDEYILKTLPNISVKKLGTQTENKIYDLINKSQKKLVLVHFWGTWCGPCISEFPELMRLIDKFKDRNDIEFLLIAANDSDNDVKKFFKTYKVFAKNSQVLLDNNNAHSTQFGVRKVPETFIFSQSFKLLRRFSGPQNWDGTYYFNYISSLLK